MAKGDPAHGAYSVQSYIAGISGENPDDACSEFLLRRDLNPDAQIKEAIEEAIRAEERSHEPA